METFMLKNTVLSINIKDFRSTLPNLGMETILANRSRTVLKLTFDQLSPIWGWKHHIFFWTRTPCIGAFLSINSPQSGDGNSKANILTLSFGSHEDVSIFRSTLPNLGMETTLVAIRLNRLLHILEPFDQLSPIWGWKRGCACNNNNNNQFPCTFDQLSPIWGWKQSNKYYSSSL